MDLKIGRQSREENKQILCIDMNDVWFGLKVPKLKMIGGERNYLDHMVLITSEQQYTKEEMK